MFRSPSKNPDEQPKSVNYFKLYDAVPTEQTPASQTTNEVDKFLPLLKDYLKSQLNFLPSSTS